MSDNLNIKLLKQHAAILETALQTVNNVSKSITEEAAALDAERVGRYAAEIVDLKGIIEAKLQQCIYERNRLERYITTIEDSLLRQVFTYRFVNGLPWQQVAACIGGSNTADGVRMMCNRYIKATEPETDDGIEVQL